MCSGLKNRHSWCRQHIFLQRSLRLESDAFCSLSRRKSLNPAGAVRRRQRDSDVNATKCAHLQCVMPVICRVQIHHHTSTPRLWTCKSSAATFFHVSPLTTAVWLRGTSASLYSITLLIKWVCCTMPQFLKKLCKKMYSVACTIFRTSRKTIGYIARKTTL